MLFINTDHIISQIVFWVFTFFFVINIVGESKTLYANTSKQNDYLTENNQWILEDQLCDQLEQQNNQLCVCKVGNENLLSLVCNAANLPDKSLDLLNDVFTLINKNENVSKLQIDAVELIGFLHFNTNETNLKKLFLPNVHVNVLRILNSDKQLVQLIELSENFQTTLHTLYIANVNIGTEVFPFLSQFGQLHSAQFSNLSFEPVIDSIITTPPNESCFNSLRKLSFNYECSPITQPTTFIKPGVFKNLCNLSWLDLSCLGLKKVPSGLLKLNFQSNLKLNTLGNTLTVDLSRNHLISISEGIADLRKIQNSVSQINLNLNYNDFTVVPEKDVTLFKENSKNHLEIWQDSETTKLNCSICANAWLANQNIIKSFCTINESHSPVLVDQVTMANLKHCVGSN